MPNESSNNAPLPSPDMMSDAQLVARAREGDAAAFEVIVRRNNRLLFRAARGVVSDDAEAQDAVQDAYLHAFMHLDSFREEAALGTWLVRITINAAFNAQRKQRRIVLHDDIPATASTQENTMPLHAPSAQTPFAAAEQHQMRDLLQTAIERLPATYRSVFMLRSVEDMSVADTALCLGVSRDVVKTRLSRARAMLRTSLATQMEPYLQSTFEFAGARCDAVLGHVMTELHRRGLVQP